MNVPLVRRAAAHIGHLIGHLMPVHHKRWARAMCREIEEFQDDREALQFAIGCLRTSAAQALLFHCARLLRGLQRCRGAGGDLMIMNIDKLMKNPRVIGVACAIGAIGLGAAYMLAAGAPARYILMNAAGLAIGLVLLAAIGRTAEHVRVPSGIVPLLVGSAVLGTALFGSTADGATRWVSIASVALQPSLILLPVLVMAFARQRDVVGGIGVALAAAALALQPDRAMAGVLAASLAVLLLLKPNRVVLGGFVAAAFAFLATLMRPEVQGASPYVDQILFTAFDVGIPAGMAVVGGASLLIVPALSGLLAGDRHREAYAVFGTIWLGIVAAAALGNYPTPLVGYGGSSILGYLLSLAMLPKAGALDSQMAQPRETGQAIGPDEASLRVGVA